MKIFEVFCILFYGLFLGLLLMLTFSSFFNVKNPITLLNILTSSVTFLLGYYFGFKTTNKGLTKIH